MDTKQKILFIDRDGTIVKEAPPTYQLDSFSKLEFYPNAFYYLRKILSEMKYKAVMVTNQDGLGSETFPLSDFKPVHEFIMKAFENEEVFFEEVLIDKSYPHEQLPTRKPGIGMLSGYINNPAIDMENCLVIGDRITDMQLAKNLGCKGIWLNEDEKLGAGESCDTELDQTVVLKTISWKEVYNYLQTINKS